MKKIISLLLLTFFISSLYGQSILPTENSEQCPYTLTTFTVTLPRIKDNTTPIVTGLNGATVNTGINSSTLIHTPAYTYATFTGVFGDGNRTQTFRITYETDSDPNGLYNANYTKIKSLLLPSIYSIINPNISSITSEICQITTHNISFSNIKFGNYDNES